MDLNTGRVRVVFQMNKTVQAALLWEAVKAGGFTPVRIEMEELVYEGPRP